MGRRMRLGVRGPKVLLCMLVVFSLLVPRYCHNCLSPLCLRIGYIEQAFVRMRCPKFTILGIVQFVMGIMTFFMGYKFGLDVKTSNLPCLKGDMDLAGITDRAPAPYRQLAPLMRHPFQIQKVYSPVIAHTVFPDLYHPARMEKSEFLVTPLKEWLNLSNYKDPFMCDEIYNTRIGSRQNQPSKCVAVVSVVDGYQSPWKHLHRMGTTAGRVNQFINDFTRREDRKEDYEYQFPFALSRDKLIKQFLSVVGEPLSPDPTNITHSKRRTLVIMVANEGVLNLLLNFVCSCAAAGIDPKSVVVFVGQEQHIHLIEHLGATPMYLPEAGSMPHKAAGNYGDRIFARMMWLKASSVYIALSAGFDVLFQDADLVWFKDPIPYLHSLEEDVAFMDDGARSGRFDPFYANSGFYFLRHNKYTLYMMERMSRSAGEMSYSHSHQGVMTKYLAEAHHFVGLKIKLLSQVEFPSGKMFHHNKTYMAELRAHQRVPYVFHMCWTANSKDKVRNFKSIDRWYLSENDACHNTAKLDSAGHKIEGRQKSLLQSCCVDPRSHKLLLNR